MSQVFADSPIEKKGDFAQEKAYNKHYFYNKIQIPLLLNGQQPQHYNCVSFYHSFSMSVGPRQAGVGPVWGAQGTIARTVTSYMVVLREVGGLGTGNSSKHITGRRKLIFKETKCVNASLYACWMMRYQRCKEDRHRKGTELNKRRKKKNLRKKNQSSNVTESQNKLWLRRKRGKRRKTDGGIKKSRGMGVLHRWDGRMGGWAGWWKIFCPSFFFLPLMTWQKIWGLLVNSLNGDNQRQIRFCPNFKSVFSLLF